MISPSLGGVFVGAALLVWEVAKWWPGMKGVRNVKAWGNLLPFVLTWGLGCLAVMTVNGLVGWFGDFLLWGLNVAGDGALVFGVGAESGPAPGTVNQPLQQGGLIMTALAFVVYLARRGKGARGSKARGVLSGVGMGLSSGVAAYAAIPLASAANVSGLWLTAAMVGT